MRRGRVAVTPPFLDEGILLDGMSIFMAAVALT
jgi:hypothetical protein